MKEKEFWTSVRRGGGKLWEDDQEICGKPEIFSNVL